MATMMHKQSTTQQAKPVSFAPAGLPGGVSGPARCRYTCKSALRGQQQRVALVRAAADEKVNEVQLGKVSKQTAAAEEDRDWVPVCKPEDLPKGVRKEFDVEGRQILMFWYRNQIFAIEARSPAEGAYSEGFIRAKFTQVSAP
eukprot:GHRR01008298.1.p1 GENE.GHRR01008298.1~~GHRR01008298.1.p1  ORF type:complete len:143 (+),score=42.04 GHRR01008298.1:162-590(+)